MAKNKQPTSSGFSRKPRSSSWRWVDPSHHRNKRKHTKSRKGNSSNFLPTRKGRPSDISNTVLKYRFKEISRELEEHWPEIAWQLMHARNPEHVRKALQCLTPHLGSASGRLISCLLKPSWESTGAEMVRATRKQSRLAISRVREIDQSVEGVCHRIRDSEIAQQEAFRSSRTAQDKGERASWRQTVGTLKVHLVARKRELDEMRALLQDAQQEGKALDEALQLHEAAFARDEVLDFIKSKRYKLTPSNLGRAIAGLPFMVWRQSMKRCAHMEDDPIPHLNYQVLKTFESVLRNRRPQSPQAAFELFERCVPRLGKAFEYPSRFISDNRVWLKEAVKQVWSAPIISKRLPFDLANAFIHAVSRPKTTLERCLAAVTSVNPAN